MNKIGKILEKLIKDSKQSREWRSFVFCLAAIVVFTTTYALILPAITVEKDKTDSVGGLVVEEADPGSTVASAEASGDVHTVEAENKVSGEVVQVEAAGNTEAAEEVREPVNGEVQTVGDKKIMTLTGEKFDVVVSCDLYAGVSDGTVLSVCGIPDANVAKSYSDRISDELLKLFVDTKSTEILYRLVFTDTDFVEYTPEGYFDVEFIFHNNTVSSDGEIIYAPRFDGEKVYAAIYDYLTDEMILAEKNGDEYETPVISLDEYGFITSITLKGLDFYEYSDVITLVGGAVNEELKLAAEKAESKPEESSEKEKKAEGSKEGKGGTLSARGSDYTVTLVYSAEAEIPDKAVLEVKEIETGTSAYTKYLEQAKAAIGLDKEQVLPQEQARFFDIRIMAGGKEIQPAANVNVSIAYDTPVVESDPRTDSQVDVNAVHFGEKGAEVVEVGDADARSVEFEAESFSIYGVIYTVDFEYSVNGKMYQFSLPGGGFVSFTDLVEVLGITGDTNSEEDGDDNTSEIDTAEAQNANGLLNVNASNAAREFVTAVESVKFSSPDLVWVGKVDAETTVGALKEAKGLECEYSAELMEEQIAGINAQTVAADDWVLISLLPFDTQESLTVTMKTGEVFTVKVTDAQLKKTVISESGETWEITVTFGPDAQIPDDAELRVREIKREDTEYADAQQKIADGLTEEELEKIPSNPVLFDISIWQGDQKIEPAEGSAVQVEVKLAGSVMKGMYTDDTSPLLVNELPLTADQAGMEKQVQVLHLTGEAGVDIVDTTDTITTDQVVSGFITDSFSNWLLFLDEDVTSVNVTTGDSLTLRPYSEWIWKQDAELDEYKGAYWYFPSSEWDTWGQWENGVYYTYYRHKTNGSQFRSFSKYDDQLEETYTVVTSVSLGTGNNGQFNLRVRKGNSDIKVIPVNVTQGSSSGKPGIIPDAIPDLTVNLFDYDVPYVNGQPDFAHSGNLDSSGNKASSVYNETINVGHDLDFLGWGYDGDGYGVNSYTYDGPGQGFVKDQLNENGFPVLNNGSNQDLDYLFDTTSRNRNVYAFPNAGGLFQLDNQGYYYYNSNSNYAEYDFESNQFILYEHTYSQNTGGSNGANAKPIGFFPFHQYDTVDTQPSMNHNKNLNHHFGMSLSVDFEIPKDRQMEDQSGNKHDIVYEFSGDDDLWVFVDDELVLDIGGLHQPVTGTINFTTGEIYVYGVDGITKNFSVGGHTLKMFYLERGGCDSNLSVRFNLPLTKGNAKIDVVKKSMTNDAAEPDIFLSGATFGIWETADCAGEPYMTATSEGNGHVIFDNLPVKEAGQVYYLREINPPSGYLLNTTVYTVVASAPDTDGNYTFSVQLNGTEIEKMTAEPYSPIIRDGRPDPISLSVTKRWENADGTELADPDQTAVFELKRNYIYVEGSEAPETSVLNVYRVNANWGNPRLMETKIFEGGSTAYVNWTYHQYLNNSFKDWQYRINNGTTQYKGNGPASIQLSAGNTTNVYIRDGNLGTQWEQYGVENITVTGTEPSSSSGITTGEGEDTAYQSPEITLPTAGGAWTDTFGPLDVMTQDGDRIYYYQYYIVEKTVPDGFEAIYLDAAGNPITDPGSMQTNVNGSQTIVNRKLLDVPIEKQWTDFSGSAYTWDATFQLEEMEEKVNASDPSAPASEVHSEFVPVDGRIMTIHKDQTPAPAFEDLPMYRVHSNGTVYRIQYSVEEIAYTVRRNGTIVAQWSKDGSLETIGDIHFVPQFEQDAGENGSDISDYVIKIVNVMENLILSEPIDLSIHKTWPEGSGIADSDDAYADFVLKRYVHQEYRDYSNTDTETEWVTITLDTWSGDESKFSTVTVPKNTQVHITGSIKPETNANRIRFTQSSGQSDIILIKDNQAGKQESFDIVVVADQTKTITLAQGDNYVVGSRDGFRLSDTYGNRTADVKDQNFAEEFRLDKANGWTASFDYLPLIEEQDIDPTTGTQTIYVYSYYLEETGCSPAGFSAAFKDATGKLLGDEQNPVSSSQTVTAENYSIIGNLKVTKELLGDVAGNENYLDKTYKVTIKNSEGKYLQNDKTTFGETPYEFTVSQSTPLEVQNLPIGSYTVSESTEEGDVSIEGYLFNIEESMTGGEATVVGSQLAVVELKNYYDEVYTPTPSDFDEQENLEVNKTWVNLNDREPSDSDSVQIKISIKSAEAYVPVKWNLYDAGTADPDDTNSLSGLYYVEPGSDVDFTMSRAANVGTAGRRIRLNSSVTMWGETGNALTFTNRVPSNNQSQHGYAPNAASVTYTARDVSAADPVEYSLQPWKGDSVWISGTPSAEGQWNMSVNVEAGKQYYTSISAMRDALIDENATIETLVYTLKKGQAPKLEEDQSSSNIRPETVTGTGWSLGLNGLPTYERVTTVHDGHTTVSYKVFSYEIEEITVNGEPVTDGKTDDYQVTYEPSETATGNDGTVTTSTNVTNTEMSIDVKLLKTDNEPESTNYLSGAVFQLLYKATADGTWANASKDEIPQLDSNSQFTIPGDSNGITLTGLKKGFYKLEEIYAPDGYVITEDTPVVFEVKHGEIVSTEGTVGAVTYNAAVPASDTAEAVPDTFIIPNVSGAALPHTGGLGTRIFTILGLILITGAGVLLWRRRRLI